MLNFSPTSPVLGDPLQLLSSKPLLRDVCLDVTSQVLFLVSPLFLLPSGFDIKASLVMLLFGFLKVRPSCLPIFERGLFSPRGLCC